MKQRTARGVTCYPFVTPKLAGWSFTSVYVQTDVRSKISSQVLALNGFFARKYHYYRKLEDCGKDPIQASIVIFK
jgi:hypothetical protein